MKKRLDVLLFERGLFDSREKARAAIMEGRIYVEGALLDKPGMPVSACAAIEVRGGDCPFVGRGGLKLQKAIMDFDISLKGLVCMDVGASTGGFTDCLLKNGAAKVYAVDVGYGQLAWKLREDPRVINIEKCNFRYFDPSSIEDRIDFMSIDVSFISLALIFPVAVKVLSDRASVVCLVKPQFEAGRSEVGKNGIVRDPAVHEEVIKKTIGAAARNGLFAEGLCWSPLKGAKGNIEYLLYLNKHEAVSYNINDACIHHIVADSHAELDK